MLNQVRYRDTLSLCVCLWIMTSDDDEKNQFKYCDGTHSRIRNSLRKSLNMVSKMIFLLLNIYLWYDQELS